MLSKLWQLFETLFTIGTFVDSFTWKRSYCFNFWKFTLIFWVISVSEKWTNPYFDHFIEQKRPRLIRINVISSQSWSNNFFFRSKKAKILWFFNQSVTTEQQKQKLLWKIVKISKMENKWKQGKIRLKYRNNNKLNQTTT